MSQRELQDFFAAQLEEVQQHSLDVTEFTKNHQLPLARIKKIMKSDEDVRMISAEAPVLFAKACEIFILELTLKAWRHAEENKRRTLQRNDVSAAIARTDIFDFLMDVVPKEDLRPENPDNCGQGQMMPGIPGMPQGAMMPQGMFPFPNFNMPPGSEAFFQGMQMPNMQMPGMQGGTSQPAQMPGMAPSGNPQQGPQGGGAQQTPNPADMLQFWQQQMASLQQSFQPQQQPQHQQQQPQMQQQPQQQPGQQAPGQAPFGNNMAPGSAPMDPAMMMSFFASLGQQGQGSFPFFPPASGSGS